MKYALFGPTIALTAFLLSQGYTYTQHTPKEAQMQKSKVSWYGERYRGRLMANGNPFNPDALTVAHRSLPFGTKVRFQHGPNVVVATVTDRGPFVAGREFDLSKAAFAALAQVEAGLITPKWEVVK
jgi:rare lipoprotein A